MLHNLGLIAAAVIVVGLVLFARYFTRMFRDVVGGHVADLNDLHRRFIRDLDKRARAHANSTNDPFATVVLDEISGHMEAVDQLKKEATEKQKKAAKGSAA